MRVPPPAPLPDPEIGPFIAATYSKVLAAAKEITHDIQDAEDAVQRASVILWRKWPTINTAKRLAYFRTCTRREALAIAKSRRPHADVDAYVELLADDYQLSEDVEIRDLAARVLPLVRHKLPRRQRIAAGLYASGLTYQEVADAMGTTPKRVRSLVSEARAILRVELDGDDHKLLAAKWQWPLRRSVKERKHSYERTHSKARSGGGDVT